jgi:gliding motility-associated-like protein
VTDLTAIGTSDGGELYFFNRVVPGGDSLVLLRADASGNVLWSREINEAEPTYGWFFSHAIELGTGGFVLSGGVAYSGNNTGPALSAILMLDANGNVLWQRQYDDLGIEEKTQNYNSGGQLAEGVGGGIVVVGNVTFESSMKITWLDAGGNVVNSYPYTPSAASYPLVVRGIQVVNGTIYLAGQYYHTNFSAPSTIDWGLWMAKIDGWTGAVEKSAFYRINHAIPFCDSLSNGSVINTAFRWGQNNQFVCAFEPMETNACSPGNFFIMRLDTGLNILPGLAEEYIIPEAAPSDNTYFGIQTNGNVAVVYQQSTGGAIDYAIIGDSNQLVEQRASGILVNGSYNTLLNLPGYDWVDIYSPAAASGDSLALFSSSAANYAPGAGCAGGDHSLVSAASPLIATPVDITWQQQSPVAVAVTTVVAPTVNLPVDTLLLCSQVSVCTSLSLHGNGVACLNDSVYTYTATKGAACLKLINWSMDTSLVALSQVDDTTVTLQFRKGGQAYLYGTLSGCDLTDSLLVVVHEATPPVHIGDDTTLCPHAVDSLYSPVAYASYMWQDGSTNAAFVVRQPGIYNVTATDFCQQLSSDTVRVQYDQESLSAGPDQQVCPLEEVTLNATGGLNSYDWQPGTSIVGDTTGPSVTIRPAQTTDYSVTARTDDGCRLSDTVTVVVTDCLNKLVMPGAFAPGQGGKNETAKPVAFGSLDSYAFSIYDRWGRVVFHSEQVGEGWDGTVGGMAQPAGTFVWICRYRFAGETEQLTKGTVILIR